jgi:hypothetical protein
MTQIDEQGIFDLSEALRRLQQEQDRNARANSGASLNDLSLAGGTPPMVTGLTLVSNIGGIHVSWTGSTITDLKTYQIQISTNAVFTSDVVTKETRETEYRWDEGTSGVTYYIRVRTENVPGNTGPWGARVNTTTGTVATADINVNAASEIHSFTKSSGFTLLNASAANEAYGPLSIDVFDNDSVVTPMLVFEFDYSATWNAAGSNYITFELFRRASGATTWGAAINSARIDVKSSIPSAGGGTARTTSPMFTNFDQPGAGVWEYQIKVTLTIAGTNALSFQGVDLDMEFIQSKR